jgi:predicted amidohydrolase YtcJ
VEKGSLVLVNGHLITSDPRRPTARALAIRNGVITTVGTDGEVLSERRSRTETIDLRGRTATAGFNDAHCHPMWVGLSAAQIDARPEGMPSIQRLVERVRERASGLPPGRWILAWGYDDARFEERRHPTRVDLDAATVNHPVLLTRACHHVAVANGEALRLAGVTSATTDPDGGSIDRDGRGEPTGVLRESAANLVARMVPRPTVEELKGGLADAADIYHRVGVTSVAEAAIRWPEELTAYQSLHEEGKLGLRSYLMIVSDDLPGSFDAGVCTGFGDRRLRIGPAKLFVDGSVGGRTARMSAPYAGQPDNFGLWVREPEAVRARLRRAHRLGWQCAAHAIGDAAIDLVLDCYEELITAEPHLEGPERRHRIEHCEFVTDPSVFDRIERLGCVPVVGTTFLRNFREVYARNLGAGRLRYANAMRSLLDRGVVAAASSDAPVVSVNPLEGIQTMVTRSDLDGQAVSVEEAITLEQAVWAYTWAGAYASFEENIKGSLTPGKVGDVAVLGADMREVEPHDYIGAGVDLTVMDGLVVS